METEQSPDQKGVQYERNNRAQSIKIEECEPTQDPTMPDSAAHMMSQKDPGSENATNSV